MTVHAEFWEKHEVRPLCGEQGPSHTMSKDRRFIDCAKCKAEIDRPCSWCRGIGSFTEWNERHDCGQCGGTGYSNQQYHPANDGQGEGVKK